MRYGEAMHSSILFDIVHIASAGAPLHFHVMLCYAFAMRVSLEKKNDADAHTAYTHTFYSNNFNE